METGSQQEFSVREVRKNRHGVRREQKAALAQEDTRLRKQAVLGDGYPEAFIILSASGGATLLGRRPLNL